MVQHLLVFATLWSTLSTNGHTVPAARIGRFTTAAHRASECRDPADCSYNGVCVIDGSCQCDPQWTGVACDVFRVVPVDVAAGTGLRALDSNGEQISSWGGSVLLGDDGLYHMWAAEMTDSTGIKSWRTNSRVVHATAVPVNGVPHRFLRQSVAMPVFAHEPTVARDPTSGNYVMFFTTNFGEVPGSQCGPPCTCGHNGTSCLSCPNPLQCPVKPAAPLSTRMAYAPTPEGPWSTPVLVPASTKGDTNLACAIRANQSMVCLGRPGLGVLTAPKWDNVSSYSWHRVNYGQGEDPMVWLDHRNGTEVLHAVTHGGGWGDPFGFHYFSTDGGLSWHGTGTKAYISEVELVGGGSLVLSRRERPHVVRAKNGTLLGLTNAVTEGWPCTTSAGVVPDRPPCPGPPPPGTLPKCGPGSNGTIVWCPVDYSHTLLQLFASD